jgi:hypothetical protein
LCNRSPIEIETYDNGTLLKNYSMLCTEYEKSIKKYIYNDQKVDMYKLELKKLDENISMISNLIKKTTLDATICIEEMKKSNDYIYKIKKMRLILNDVKVRQ